MDVQLPTRSCRYGVGKEIGGAVYLHRRYEKLLGAAIDAAIKHLPPDFDYHVVKHKYTNGSMSFIQCPEFDAVPEPEVGEILIVDAEGSVRRRRPPRDPEIYHHKWLFVAADYEGFDVESSKRRSIAWMKLDGIDRKRIGKKSYWEKCVLPQLGHDEDES